MFSWKNHVESNMIFSLIHPIPVHFPYTPILLTSHTPHANKEYPLAISHSFKNGQSIAGFPIKNADVPWLCPHTRGQTFIFPWVSYGFPMVYLATAPFTALDLIPSWGDPLVTRQFLRCGERIQRWKAPWRFILKEYVILDIIYTIRKWILYG